MWAAAREREAAARAAVRRPAAGLIAVGVLTLLGAGVNLVRGEPGRLAAEFNAHRDRRVWAVHVRPGPADERKRAETDLTVRLFDAVKWVTVTAVVVLPLGGAVVVVGGVRMRRLQGRGWATAAAVLAAVPCVSGIWAILGIPVGVWALTVLARPAVAAAFAAARGPHFPIDHYLGDDR